MSLTDKQMSDIGAIYDIAQKHPLTKELYASVKWTKNAQDQWEIETRTPLSKEDVLQYSRENVLPPMYHIIMLGLAARRQQLLVANKDDKAIQEDLNRMLHMDIARFVNTVLVRDGDLLVLAEKYMPKDIDASLTAADFIANIGCNVMLWATHPENTMTTGHHSPSEFLHRFSIFQLERSDRGRGLFGGLGDDRALYINSKDATITSLDPDSLATKSGGAIRRTIAREFEEEMQDAGSKEKKATPDKQVDKPQAKQSWLSKFLSFIFYPVVWAYRAIFSSSHSKDANVETGAPQGESGNAVKDAVSSFISHVVEGVSQRKYTSNVTAYPDYSFIPRDWGAKSSGGYFYLENFKANPFAVYSYCNAMECDYTQMDGVISQLASAKKEGEVRSVFKTTLPEVLDNCYTATKTGRDGFCYIHEAVGAWDLAYQRLDEGIKKGQLQNFKNADEALITLVVERAEEQLRKTGGVHIDFDRFTEADHTAHISANTFSLMKQAVSAVRNRTVEQEYDKLLEAARNGTKLEDPALAKVSNLFSSLSQQFGGRGEGVTR